VPLHVWLIDAMEGHTVSALIHAATMVGPVFISLPAPSLFLKHPTALIIIGISAIHRTQWPFCRAENDIKGSWLFTLSH